MKKFIPKNLDDILEWLDKNVPEADKQGYINTAPVHFHFTTGMYLRNFLGFWDEKSVIHKWFLKQGIFHADDMSGIVLESFARKLRGDPIDLEGQVQHYQEYWNRKPGTPEWKMNKSLMK